MYCKAASDVSSVRLLVCGAMQYVGELCSHLHSDSGGKRECSGQWGTTDEQSSQRWSTPAGKGETWFGYLAVERARSGFTDLPSVEHGKVLIRCSYSSDMAHRATEAYHSQIYVQGGHEEVKRGR